MIFGSVSAGWPWGLWRVRSRSREWRHGRGICSDVTAGRGSAPRPRVGGSDWKRSIFTRTDGRRSVMTSSWPLPMMTSLHITLKQVSINVVYVHERAEWFSPKRREQRRSPQCCSLSDHKMKTIHKSNDDEATNLCHLPAQRNWICHSTKKSLSAFSATLSIIYLSPREWQLLRVAPI